MNIRFRKMASAMAEEYSQPDTSQGNSDILCANDVLSAKLDREPWSGKVHEPLKLAVAEQILRSIATEQPGASSTVKALAESYFEAVK